MVAVVVEWGSGWQSQCIKICFTRSLVMSTRPNNLRKMFVLTPLLPLYAARVSRKSSWWGGDIDPNYYFHTLFFFFFLQNCQLLKIEHFLGIGFLSVFNWRCFIAIHMLQFHVNIKMFLFISVRRIAIFVSFFLLFTLSFNVIGYPLTRTLFLLVKFGFDLG